MSFKIGKLEIRPEINKTKYWVHIVILALLVQLFLSPLHDTGALFSIHTVHFSLAIAGADIIAHTLLGFD